MAWSKPLAPETPSTVLSPCPLARHAAPHLRRHLATRRPGDPDKPLTPRPPDTGDPRAGRAPIENRFVGGVACSGLVPGANHRRGCPWIRLRFRCRVRSMAHVSRADHRLHRGVRHGHRIEPGNRGEGYPHLVKCEGWGANHHQHQLPVSEPREAGRRRAGPKGSQRTSAHTRLADSHLPRGVQSIISRPLRYSLSVIFASRLPTPPTPPSAVRPPRRPSVPTLTHKPPTTFVR